MNCYIKISHAPEKNSQVFFSRHVLKILIFPHSTTSVDGEIIVHIPLLQFCHSTTFSKKIIFFYSYFLGGIFEKYK